MNYENMAELLFEELKPNASSSSLAEILNEFNRGEVGVLSYLVFDKDIVSAGELSDKLSVTTARVASILKSLESKGFIKKQDDVLDKRKTLVVITKKGKDLAMKTKQEIINKIIKVIKEVGIDEIKEYAKIALKIRNVLNKQ